MRSLAELINQETRSDFIAETVKQINEMSNLPTTGDGFGTNDGIKGGEDNKDYFEKWTS
ncbi:MULTISPECIES: hypothetical protein [unclassified Azospirillum]|jgi:hypothetical protein|uniref:hypothetical protein n=1 Tax=unclassified Azospirillum TaxID=2630922 RepID=UPI000B750F02|nr:MULTISPECIES: hypothetical protein [unclassified Azospirillum]SNS88172.1 hypothetical protein SAMN05880556_11454 [Azospirillum sp. RU38E]SNT05164.1 hypothetical protein SAMN05880591_11454 [Azospirillum sp. RU37A]